MSQQLTRKQLYDLVWSKPMTQLSKEFGLSDNGLRKICKKYDIPMPKQGHWQTVQYGGRINQVKLIENEKWTDTKITINETEIFKEEHYLTKLTRRVKEIQIACEKILPVPDNLSKPHSLIKAAKTNLSSKNKNTSWRKFPQCISTDDNLISINVQKHNVPRSLRILDTLFKMFELRKHKIVIKNRSTTLIVDEEEYTIRFRETHTRIEIPGETWRTTELVPTDKLSIKYGNYNGKEWIDARELLEFQLPKILAFFELRSVKDKEDRAETERWHEEYERNRQIELKLQAQRERELKKKDFLLLRSQEWRKAEDLSKFIFKIEQSDSISSKTKDWIQWAKLRQIELDPLSQGIDSFISSFDLPEHLKD